MGKSSKPIKLVVHHSLWQTPEVLDLVAKQHEVTLASLPDDALYIGPNAWRMTLDLIKHLPVAVKSWRDLQYGIQDKTAPTGEDGTKPAKVSKPRKRSAKRSTTAGTGGTEGQADTASETGNSSGLKEAI